MHLPRYLLCMSIVVTSLSCSRPGNEDGSSKEISAASEPSPIGAATLHAEAPSTAIADETESVPQLPQWFSK